jgi:hypothetical protein
VSTLEIILAVAVIYLAGALALVMAEETYRKDELAALAAWPLFVPFALTVRTIRRWRYTCRDCGGNYGDRERYDRHMVKRSYCTVPSTIEPNGDDW